MTVDLECKVNFLKRFFLNRTDRVAALMPWGKPHPIEGGEHLEALLRAHVGGEVTPKAVARYSNRRSSIKVESGHYRIGSYTPDQDGNTRWLCLDFDGGSDHADSLVNPEAAALASIHACEEFGLSSYLERSGGGHGWHLWMFFDQPIPAEDARRLGFAIAPRDCPLVSGGTANVRRGAGVELFPKTPRIKKHAGYGSQLWLPFWHGAPEGANQFYRMEDDKLVAFAPDSFETVTPNRLAEVLVALPRQPDSSSATPGTPAPDQVTASTSGDDQDPAVQKYLNAVKNAEAEHASAPSSWKAWREKALAAVPLESVYGSWLTGAKSGEHWFECRDPGSPSGDLNPSAGVADGTGDAPRGTFHSFRDQSNLSVFDFLMKHGMAASFPEAVKKISEFSGVPLPDDRKNSNGHSLPSRSRDFPEIIVNNRQLRSILWDSWQVIHAENGRNPFLFLRAGRSVQLNRSVSPPQIEGVDPVYMHGRLLRLAEWVRETEECVLAAVPPHDVSRDMAGAPDPNLPPLDAICTAPVFDGEGNLLVKPGYHRQAALWYEPPQGFEIEPVPPKPSRGDLDRAKTLLFDDLLVDFPFTDDSDRAHMIAAMLLPFVRQMIGSATPLHVVEAPEAGTGKGLLADLVSLIATGRMCSVTTFPKAEEEVRKKITTLLAAGRNFITWDNVSGLLDSPSLAAALTSQIWEDRILGETSVVVVPNNALWMLTANNLRMSKEIARRCVRIRIDAKREHPADRREEDFKHPKLRLWTRKNRGSLVWAILVLVRTWLADGRPGCCGPTLGSYEEWTEVIGGILNSAGIPGFLGNLRRLREEADLESAELRAFVHAWHQEGRDRPLKPADLNDLCEREELLMPQRGDGSPRSQASRLGRLLTSLRDRVFDGLRVRVEQDRKGAAYRLEQVKDAEHMAMFGRSSAGSSAGVSFVDSDGCESMPNMPNFHRHFTRVQEGKDDIARDHVDTQAPARIGTPPPMFGMFGASGKDAGIIGQYRAEHDAEHTAEHGDAMFGGAADGPAHGTDPDSQDDGIDLLDFLDDCPFDLAGFEDEGECGTAPPYPENTDAICKIDLLDLPADPDTMEMTDERR